MNHTAIMRLSDDMVLVQTATFDFEAERRAHSNAYDYGYAPGPVVVLPTEEARKQFPWAEPSSGDYEFIYRPITEGAP